MAHMLRRTGVGSAFNNWRRANPRLAHLLPEMALDASSRDIDRACSPSSGRQVDRLSPVSSNDRGHDPRSKLSQMGRKHVANTGGVWRQMGTRERMMALLIIWSSSVRARPAPPGKPRGFHGVSPCVAMRLGLSWCVDRGGLPEIALARLLHAGDRTNRARA